MSLNTIWFILITVLYIGFFLLEGFDFGVGVLLLILGRDSDADKKDLKRRTIINSIGPHWDGNEVWLITAGGATFAAFPHWYATFFSGFYLPLFLLLLALILRGVAFEFRSKDDSPRWRKTWDLCIFIGSLLPPVLLGVAFANLVRGVPIDSQMNYVGGFFNLLNPYALLAGVATLGLFSLHGAIFLSLKVDGELADQAQQLALRLWLPVAGLSLLLLVGSYLSANMLVRLGVIPAFVVVIGIAAILLCGVFLHRQRRGWAFVMTASFIILALATFFLILYPNVMISSLDPTWSLTIENAASSPYTLRVMTIVALIFVPIVLLYQGWSYWVFRKRIEAKSEQLTY